MNNHNEYVFISSVQCFLFRFRFESIGTHALSFCWKPFRIFFSENDADQKNIFIFIVSPIILHPFQLDEQGKALINPCAVCVTVNSQGLCQPSHTEYLYTLINLIKCEHSQPDGRAAPRFQVAFPPFSIPICSYVACFYRGCQLN